MNELPALVMPNQSAESVKVADVALFARLFVSDSALTVRAFARVLAHDRSGAVVLASIDSAVMRSSTEPTRHLARADGRRWRIESNARTTHLITQHRQAVNETSRLRR